MEKACNDGNVSKVEKLLSQFPDMINCSLDENGSTLLHRYQYFSFMSLCFGSYAYCIGAPSSKM
jgi:hypothetical protein